MFTGVIREFGKVESFQNSILKIGAKYVPEIGDSIAINGACLTVIELGDGFFSVELSSESAKSLALENYKNRVHIEPAMRLIDRVEGHIMQGHIDFIGVVKEIKRLNVGVDFLIEVDKEANKFMIPKGSVAIDGISLTINSVFDKSFRVTIIPHTLRNTLFESYSINRRVNIESDMIVRSLFHLNQKNAQANQTSWSDIERASYLY